ncbi:MAG: DUF389 domain-containing protein [Luteibaculaceae bacterium]
MKNYLLYQEASVGELELALKEFPDLIFESKIAVEDQSPDFSKYEGCKLWLFLSKEQIHSIFNEEVNTKVIFLILPHPESTEICVGLGINLTLEDAIKDYLKAEKEFQLDLMYCNNEVVFNSVVIGNTFQLVTSNKIKKLGFFKQTKLLFSQLFKLEPFRVSVFVSEEKSFTTTVSGIFVVQHGKSTLLSRLIVDDSFANDGLFHSFLISPRSVSGLALFFIRSIFKQKTLPPFAAHIKTGEIHFSADKEFKVSVDGESKLMKEVKLTVKKQAIAVVPGAFLRTEGSGTNSGTVYKIKELPLGEAAEALEEKKLPLLKQASTDEFKDLFKILRDNAKLKSTFLVLMVLSTAIATFGLFLNSSPVIIGAMILAPLMSPIISLSMAALRQDRSLATQSGITIAAGLAFSFAVGVILTWITPIKVPNEEIVARIRPNLLDLGVAVFSGIAGAYAHAREEIAKTLAGVAIAVALVPPLAVAAIGLGWLNWEIYSGATLLLLTNLVGMVLAGAITFLLLGFSPVKRAKKGLVLTAVLFFLLSVPLGIGFYKMVREHRIIQELEGWESKEITVKEVKVIRNKPLQISVKLVSNKMITENEIEEIKENLEKKLGREAEFEVNLAIKK